MGMTPYQRLEIISTIFERADTRAEHERETCVSLSQVLTQSDLLAIRDIARNESHVMSADTKIFIADLLTDDWRAKNRGKIPRRFREFPELG
jgi:hypothetical protein